MSDETSYVKPEFNPPGAAETFAANSRFGHTSDFSRLFASSDEQDDYIRGLAILGFIIFAFFFAWFFLILVFRCLGRRRVGFLSGSPFHRDIDKGFIDQQMKSRTAVNNMAEVLVDYYEGNSLSKRPTRVRICFLISGAIFIIFAILAVTQGMTNLQSTVDTVTTNAKLVDSLSQEAEDILNAVKGIRENGVRIRDLLVKELESGNFCPADNTFESSQTAKDIVDQANAAIPYLNQLNDFVGDDVDQLEGATHSIQKGASTVHDDTEDIDFTSWQGLLVLIPFTILPAILMAGTILAMFDVEFRWFSCMNQWIILPLFFIMVSLACILTAVMLSSASANADFCLPNAQPEARTVDTSILRIVQEEGYSNETLEYKIFTYYMQSCKADNDPFQFIRDFEPQLKDANSSLTKLSEQLRDSSVLTDLELHCNRDFTVLNILIGDMTEVLLVIIDALQRTLDLLACDTIVPIYTNVFYEGTCSYSISAIMWIFSGFLTTSFLGLLMICLRSSFKKTVYVIPDLALTVSKNGARGDSLVHEMSPDEDSHFRDSFADYGLDNSPTPNKRFSDPRI